MSNGKDLALVTRQHLKVWDLCLKVNKSARIHSSKGRLRNTQHSVKKTAHEIKLESKQQSRVRSTKTSCELVEYNSVFTESWRICAAYTVQCVGKENRQYN